MDGICTGGGDLCLDAILLDFGEVEQFESRQAYFTLTNAGDANLTVEAVQLTAGSSGAFSLVDSPSAPSVLAAQQTLVIGVRFAPTGQGLHTGQVDIFSDDPEADPESHLTGSVALAGMSPAMTCRLVATPDSLHFTDVPIGGSQVQTVRFDNQGNAACTLESLVIQQESPPGVYSLAGAPDLPSTVEPEASFEVGVQYTPDDFAEDTGALELRGSGPEAFFLGVSLAGTGIVPPACRLVLDPTMTVFPQVEAGYSATQPVTLRNEGDAPCLVESVLLGQTPMQEISYAGDFEFAAEPAVPFTIEPEGQVGDQVEIEIAFVPQQFGSHATTLWVHTPDMAEQIPGPPGCMNPQTGQMAGPGDGCANVLGNAFEVDVETIPSSLDFGVVTLGCNSVEMQASLYNRSRDPLTINDIVLADPSDVNFEIRQAPPTPVFLGPGDAADVTLRYTPQTSGTHSNALHLVTNTGGPLVEVVDLTGHATVDTEQADLFVQESQVMTDVLFVIDNSGSMDTAQASLIDNFPAFIGWAASTNADYHIGVIATEVNDAESGMGSPPRDILPGVLVQAPGRPKILTNATADLAAAFTDNANLGTCCSDEQEAGLQAAWMALSAPLADDPDANAGFVREGARLYIIILSDEQDQSPGTPEDYFQAFGSIKGPATPVLTRISAIVGDIFDSCEDNPDPGTRYIELADWSGGLFISFCTDDWAQAMSDLGADAFSYRAAFVLSRPADDDTLVVTVDGQSVSRCAVPGCPDGWTYYPDINTLEFGADVAPAAGEQVEVVYSAMCLQENGD